MNKLVQKDFYWHLQHILRMSKKISSRPSAVFYGHRFTSLANKIVFVHKNHYFMIPETQNPQFVMDYRWLKIKIE